MQYILGLETSCDDSCLGIVDIKNSKIIFNKVYSQDDLHSKFGGVVPEIASRGHLKNIPILIDNFVKSKQINFNEILLLAVTCRPGLIGSLLLGTSFIKGLAWSWNKKLVGIDHLEAHLLSPLIDNLELKFPYLCFLLSGGHSLAVLVKNVGDYQLLGKTQDDALGEAFDKVAKMLGFQYPGGPIIEKIAKQWSEEILDLPLPLKNTTDYNFSYSGLKTATKKLAAQMGIYADKVSLINYDEFFQLKKKEKIAQLAASFQHAALNSLLFNLSKIIKKYKIKNFAISGGVARNKFINKNLKIFCKKNEISFFSPSLEYCSDNGAMIAFCAYQYQKNNILTKITNLDVQSKSYLF